MYILIGTRGVHGRMNFGNNPLCIVKGLLERGLAELMAQRGKTTCVMGCKKINQLLRVLAEYGRRFLLGGIPKIHDSWGWIRGREIQQVIKYVL